MADAQAFPPSEETVIIGQNYAFTTNARTNDYTATNEDAGKLISMNKSTPLTLTLPAFPPALDWWILVETTGVGALTINRNGKTIDGAASNITLQKDQGLVIFTDGVNYFTSRGVGGGSATPGLIQVTIDGGTVVPTTGSKGYGLVPYSATILKWTLLADVSGSAQITLKKCTYSGFPSTTSIVASAPPALVAQQKNTDSTLTGWTTSITAGDIIEAILDSISTIKRLYLVVELQRS